MGVFVLQQDEADSHQPGLRLAAEVLQDPIILILRLCQANQSLFFLLHQPQKVRITWPIFILFPPFISTLFFCSSLCLTNRVPRFLAHFLSPFLFFLFFLSSFFFCLLLTAPWRLSFLSATTLCSEPVSSTHKEPRWFGSCSRQCASDTSCCYVIKSDVTYLTLSPN